jgi:hypothetical protein
MDQKLENETLALQTQSATFSEALEQSLRLLGAAFRQEITEPIVVAYAIGCEGLAGFQIIRATRWLLAHHEDFMPTPAQIVRAVTQSADRNFEVPTEEIPSDTVPRCELCGGTGWKVVPNPTNPGHTWAVRCECRKKKSA